MSCLLWILGSLLAISFIGDLPRTALLLTGLTGIGMGLSAYADDAIARLTARNREHQVSRATLERVFPASVFNVPIMALVIMLLPSLWISPDVMTGFGSLLQLLVGIAVFYVSSAGINTRNGLCWAVYGLVAVGVLIALLVPVTIGLADAKFWAFAQVPEAIRQTLIIRLNPNTLAGGLIPILSIATALFLNAPFEWVTSGVRGYVRLLLAIALITMFAALLLTQSRGGIVAMGVALLFLITSKRWWIGGALIGTLLFSLVGNNGMAISRLLDFSLLTGAVDGLPNREEIWWRAVFMLQRVPYSGIGLGAFSRAVPALYPMLVTEPQVDLYHAHNLYLQVGVDLGIPGLAAFISILVVGLGVTTRQVCSTHQNHWTDESAVALGLGTGLIAIIVHGFVDCPLWGYSSAVILWVVLGLIGAVAKSNWSDAHLVR